MRYPWWRLEPHPEWMEPHWSKENYLQSYCAGIPGELRVAFLPATWDPPRLKQLENSVSYYAFYFNPASGKQYDLGKVTPDVNGTWQASNAPIFQDWVLVLEKR